MFLKKFDNTLFKIYKVYSGIRFLNIIRFIGQTFWNLYNTF